MYKRIMQWLSGWPVWWSVIWLKFLHAMIHVCKGLAALVNDIINGDLPMQAKDFILSSRLIAIVRMMEIV